MPNTNVRPLTALSRPLPVATDLAAPRPAAADELAAVAALPRWTVRWEGVRELIVPAARDGETLARVLVPEWVAALPGVAAGIEAFAALVREAERGA